MARCCQAELDWAVCELEAVHTCAGTDYHLAYDFLLEGARHALINLCCCLGDDSVRLLGGLTDLLTSLKCDQGSPIQSGQPRGKAHSFRDAISVRADDHRVILAHSRILAAFCEPGGAAFHSLKFYKEQMELLGQDRTGVLVPSVVRFSSACSLS